VFVYADYSYLNAFDEFIDDLNNDEYKPKFDVNIKNNDIEKIKFKVSTKKFLAFGFWHTSNLKIGIYKISYKEENEELWNYANKNGIVIPFPIHFLTDGNNFYVTPFNLTPFFKKILRERQHENVYREGKREINKELNFFKELIKKELEVIEKNALKLRYKDFEKKGDYEIWFIKE